MVDIDDSHLGGLVDVVNVNWSRLIANNDDDNDDNDVESLLQWLSSFGGAHWRWPVLGSASPPCLLSLSNNHMRQELIHPACGSAGNLSNMCAVQRTHQKFMFIYGTQYLLSD